jgi:hypothetical protein
MCEFPISQNAFMLHIFSLAIPCVFDAFRYPMAPLLDSSSSIGNASSHSLSCASCCSLNGLTQASASCAYHTSDEVGQAANCVANGRGNEPDTCSGARILLTDRHSCIPLLLISLLAL